MRMGVKLAHMLERLAFGRIVDHHDALRATVIRAGDRAEALLARSVPNVQLDDLSIEVDRADFLGAKQKTHEQRKEGAHRI